MINKIQQFQVFAKPIGASCNLNCHYCYYHNKEEKTTSSAKTIMDDDTLEEYIIQHIAAADANIIHFSWHGGEPTLLGIEYFKKIVSLQQKHKLPQQNIINGIQTNGTLINEAWCKFLARENFSVGVSLDGPKDLHDIYRQTSSGKSSFDDVMRGIELLKKHQIFSEILCVVHKHNVKEALKIYHFFKKIGASYLSFLPLVDKGSKCVSAKDYGQFLCDIFDEWQRQDIGKLKIQIIEETARTAFNQSQSLCIFREKCGGVPVIEHDGSFYPCDHFVNPEHLIGNIKNSSLEEMLNSTKQKAFGEAKFTTLPDHCLNCEVRQMCNGGCPKNRFILTPDGQSGLNYLCEGYKLFFNHIQGFLDAIKKYHHPSA